MSSRSTREKTDGRDLAVIIGLAFASSMADWSTGLGRAITVMAFVVCVWWVVDRNVSRG